MTFPVLDVPTEYTGRPGPVTIYALVDPRDSTVRYVGQTTDTVRRLARHMSAGTSSGNPEKLVWLASLKRASLRPLLVELQKCKPAEATDAEEHWIRRFAGVYNIMARHRVHRRPRQPKCASLGVNLTVAEHRAIARVATREGDMATTWARKAILRAVEAALDKRGKGNGK